MQRLPKTGGSEPLSEFTIGQRVKTVEGYPGTIDDILEGPASLTTLFVTLDGGMGGGEYAEGEVQPLTEPTTAGRIDATITTAAEDYPELGTILSDRLPPKVTAKQADEHGPVYDPQTIPPGWGAHIGDGEWVTRCPQEGCDHLIPGNLPVDIQRHLWDAHQVTAPLLPGGKQAKTAKFVVTCDECGKKHEATYAHEGVHGEGSIFAVICPEDGLDLTDYYTRERVEEVPDTPSGLDLSTATAEHLALYLPPKPRNQQGGSLAEVPQRQKAGYKEGFAHGKEGITRNPSQPEDEDFRIGYDLGWAEGVTVLREPANSWDIDDLGKDQTADVPLNPLPTTMSPTTAGAWQDLKDMIEESGRPGHIPSFDWCRFRRESRCWLPKGLNEEASRLAGYAVWVPQDRGPCPRFKWTDQQKCPTGAPGPHAGPGGFTDATVAWEQGGQRTGEPGMEWADPNKYTSALGPVTGAFEFTAVWKDIQTKAKRIRSAGGVRVVSVADNVMVGHIRGDTGVYETEIVSFPGKRNAATWHCGCKWGSYSWGRSGPWKRYEGRMCSHALALQYEAQSRGFGGKEVTLDSKQPAWMDQKQVHRPGDYDRNRQRYSSVDGLESGLHDLHPLHETPVEEPPVTVLAAEMLVEGAKYPEIREMLLSLGVESPAKVVASARSAAFKARVDGEFHDIDIDNDGFHDETGEPIDPARIEYPKWHPTLGLDPRDEKVLTVAAVPPFLGEEDWGLDRQAAINGPQNFEAAAKAMMEMARRNEPDTTLMLATLALEHGGDMVGLDFRFKAKDSLLRKMQDRLIEGDANRTAYGINDSLRYTMMFPTGRYTAGTKGVLTALADSGYRAKVDNYWEKGDPYDGINCTLMTPKGHPFELQFHTPESLKAKDLTHRLYEDWRTNPNTEVRKELAAEMIGIAAETPVPSGILSLPTLKRRPLSSLEKEAIPFLHLVTDPAIDTKPMQGFESLASYDWVHPQIATGGAIRYATDLRQLQRKGVVAIVSGRRDFEDSLLAEGRDLGIAFLSNPTPDNGDRKPVSWFKAAIDFCLPVLRRGGRVYVHCHAGMNRGPSMAYAVLRAYTGMDHQRAMHAIQSARTTATIAYAADADAALVELGYAKAPAQVNGQPFRTLTGAAEPVVNLTLKGHLWGWSCPHCNGTQPGKGYLDHDYAAEMAQTHGMWCYDLDWDDTVQVVEPDIQSESASIVQAGSSWQKTPNGNSYRTSVQTDSGETVYITMNYYDHIEAFTEHPSNVGSGKTMVGGMSVWTQGADNHHEVFETYVEPEYRRQGIGRAMFSLSKEGLPDLVHSDVLSADGKEFAKAVAGKEFSQVIAAIPLRCEDCGETYFTDGEPHGCTEKTAARQPPARLFHYTSEMHWPAIVEHGGLTLTESNIEFTGAGPRVVWLTTTPTEAGNGLLGKGTVRIEIDTAGLPLHHWPTWSREQGIEDFWYDALTTASGGDPDSWWVCTVPIPVGRFAEVQVRGKTIEGAKTADLLNPDAEVIWERSPGDLLSDLPLAEELDHVEDLLAGNHQEWPDVEPDPRKWDAERRRRRQQQWTGSKTAAHGTLWHVTDNPRFALDPEHEPGGGNNEVGLFGKGLFLTDNPELWHYLWGVKEYGQRSLYAAEVEAPTARRLGAPDDDRDQYFVAPTDYSTVRVKRVVPIKQAETVARRSGFGFALIAADAIEPARICVVDHRKGWGNSTALCGGVTDGNPIKWTTTAWVRNGPITDRICPECMAVLRKTGSLSVVADDDWGLSALAAGEQWLINGKPYRDGVWIEVEPDVWYRGADSMKGEIPSRIVVRRDGEKWAWQAQVLTFIGAPHEDTGWQKPGAPKGVANTLEAAQDRALRSLTKDHEFFRRYDERQRATLEREFAPAHASLDETEYAHKEG